MSVIQPKEKILTIWRIVLSLATIPTAFLTSFLLKPGSKWWWFVSGLWIVLFFACYLFYLPARYFRISFGLSEGKVCMEKGVFYRQHISLPVGNIQFATIIADPIHQIFRLCSLIVVAPGARIVLPGLTRQDAEDLASILTGR